MECYLCNASGNEIKLHKAIHKKFGIVLVCEKCFFKEKMPLLNKKEINMEEINKRETVRERLSRLAHIDPNVPKEEVKKWENPENIKLNDIIERNLKIEHVPKELVGDLVDNFNWVIMRKRRMMKLTISELGEAIQESPIILEALEKGSLPRNYPTLIKKIENHLGINLFVSEKKVLGSTDILAERKSPRGILISDLKKTFLEKDVEEKALNEIVDEKLALGRIKEEEIYEDSISLEELNLDKIKKLVGEPVKEKKKIEEDIFYKKQSEKSEIKEDLSQKDIEDLIFGNK